MSETIVAPKFATEAEEADWWFDHREAHDTIMAQAMREGHTLPMKQVAERRAVEGLRVAVEIDSEDVRRVRQQAVGRGVHPEDYMRELLHEALVRNDAA